MDTDAVNAVAVTREIALCWLAHALSSSARRLRVEAPSVERVELLSVRPAVDPHDALASLLHAIQRVEDAHDAVLTITSVATIRELLAQPAHASEVATVKVVCVEMAPEAWTEIQSTLVRLATTTPSTITWLLVGVSITSGGVCVRTTAYPPGLDMLGLKTAFQPLRDLQQQCGLPMALELLASIDPSFQQPVSADGPPRTPTKVSHMPFHLLLMLLRWSYFHPRVVSLIATPFIRKLTLIPQPRVQHEILEMFHSNRKLWTNINASLENVQVQTLSSSLAHARVNHFQLPHTEETDDDDPELPPLRRLSECTLWDKQKQFYRNQGIQAWSNHLIPFGVSSSSFLARQYARLAVDFFTLQLQSSTPDSTAPRTPNCYVWEAASGSCKFLHAFLLHFYELVAAERLEERLGIVPCVVASDLSDQVLQSREEMACFHEHVTTGRLDFALFDTDSYLAGPEKSSLYLRNAKRQWLVGHEGGPVFIIGNYFFDSLRADVLVATQHKQPDSTSASIEVREALIDTHTDRIPDMLFSLHTLDVDPRDGSAYGNAALDTTLASTLNRLENDWTSGEQPETSDAESVTRSSLILFPTEAIRLLDSMLRSTFPVAVIAGDATFNFRDSVPSSFVDQDTGDLEIPQLSPHPDCFCLPVDFEILQHFVASVPDGVASIVSTPSSDTFNVFFAQSPRCSANDQTELDLRFREAFAQFTPCDCDLLWGMMRVDDGTNMLAFDTQLALLTQTAWDFDVFSIVQWGLLRFWKAEKQRLQRSELDQARLESTRESFVELDHVRGRLVDIGRKSARTFYVLDERSRSRDTSAAVATLQLARWFFELGDFAHVSVILENFKPEHPRLHAGSLYLLGLAFFQLKNFWAALGCFRKGLQLEPRRQRLKKWVARTLLRLQEIKTSASSASVLSNMN